MTFQWTPQSRLQAAQHALAYITLLHSRPAGTGMTEPDNFLTSTLDGLTDAGADSEEALMQLLSGMTSVMNLTVKVAAQRCGLSPSELLSEVGAGLVALED
ncbi:hypothetical protein DAVIS_01257 [Mycobacterium marinum]|uniref:Uncharacterized protein n=1 Tax=Mycobacterium marinum TaxID=1781 RepID=A0A3E2N0B1_MYCMR|nr:hypothetical protein [Mycobacterium marinum]RFZ45427.1 hypothetical protein DAVIS_01257 [Mycobacterium marinum]GJO50651.1 hypothetical protein NJB1604_37250 [Mycobacterium marinum]